MIISLDQRNKFLDRGFILLIFVYHVLPIMHNFFGETQFLGKNLYITIPALFIIFSFLFFMPVMTKKWFIFFVFLILLYVFTTFIVIIVFDYDLNTFLYRRYFFIPIFMGVAIFNFLKDPQLRWLVLRMFLVATILQCIFGVVHDAFFQDFHYAVLSEEDGYFIETISGRTREAGTMISASCYSYVLLMGLMILTYLDDLPFGLSKIQFRLGLFFFIFYGVLLSGSRGPIVLAIFLLSAMIMRKKSIVKNIPTRMFIVILSLFVFFYFGLDEIIKSGVFDRTLSEGSGGRYEKLLLGPLMLSQKFYLLTGVPVDVQVATEINGVGFSDNSFLMLLITFGIAALLPISCILYMLLRFSNLTRTKLPAIIGLVCLSTTNSILWEPWIFYYCVGMGLIFYCSVNELPQRRYRKATLSTNIEVRS